MENHWKKLLPVDRYKVSTSGLIQATDVKIITLLYQPLVGAKAYSLFMTLLEENGAVPSSHHSLLSQTQMNLQHIYEERKKLEAIGLLKTYMKNKEEGRLFIYELQPALAPEQFFQDDVLSVYLYGRLGKKRYLDIKKRFAYPKQNTQELEEVTANFNDVFSSLHESELRAGTGSELHQTVIPQTELVGSSKGKSPVFSPDDFDFETLVRDLSSFIIPSDVLTKEIKASIYRLAFIYQIPPLEMSSIVQQAYFREESLTVHSLRYEVQRWYKIEKPGQLPRLSDRVHSTTATKPNETSPEAIMIHTFETISPRTLLEKYSDGGRAASSDLKLIESIMFDQKLPPGVINVLLDYVLNTNDMKLVHGHVEKIASQWKRKKIFTVKAAMELAKAEHRNYKSYQQQKTRQSNQTQRKNVRKDTLPKWMAQTTETDKKRDKPVSETDEKWMEEYLKGL